jgi:uncharacterized protein (TIGR02444 family)
MLGSLHIMTDSLPDAWTGIVALYGKDGVAEMCLEWQERVDLDVPLFLFVAHVAQSGFEIRNLSELQAWTDQWRREVVVPLRSVRRYLKPIEDVDGAQALRDRVKKEELQAEKLQIEEMVNRADLHKGGSVADIDRFLVSVGLTDQQAEVVRNALS